MPPKYLLQQCSNQNRSNDGLTLIMSSSDGFCSTLSFAPGELGQPYTAPIPASHPASSAASSVPTPAHAISPIKTSHAASTTTAPSTVSQPPASPARSNSACSITTQSSAQQPAVVNNPTPTFGAVPLVTAANSSQPPALPLSTPPQTPMSTVSQSGPNSVSGSVLGKRDTRPASETEKDESKGQDAEQPKKRRVAPTLVSAGDNPASRDDSQKTDAGG